MLVIERKDYMVELKYSSADNWRIIFSLLGGHKFDDGNFELNYTSMISYPEDEEEEEYFYKQHLIRLIDCLDDVAYYIHQLEPDYTDTFSQLVITYLRYENPNITDVPEWKEMLEIE